MSTCCAVPLSLPCQGAYWFDNAGVSGSPSVNLFIDPLGGVRLISSHEQMFCPPYRAIGSSFPQSSVPPVALSQAALAVGKACYAASKLSVSLAILAVVRACHAASKPNSLVAHLLNPPFPSPL